MPPALANFFWTGMQMRDLFVVPNLLVVSPEEQTQSISSRIPEVDFPIIVHFAYFTIQHDIRQQIPDILDLMYVTN